MRCSSLKQPDANLRSYSPDPSGLSESHSGSAFEGQGRKSRLSARENTQMQLSSQLPERLMQKSCRCCLPVLPFVCVLRALIPVHPGAAGIPPYRTIPLSSLPLSSLSARTVVCKMSLSARAC